jgi:hypothetical protein
MRCGDLSTGSLSARQRSRVELQRCVDWRINLATSRHRSGETGAKSGSRSPCNQTSCSGSRPTPPPRPRPAVSDPATPLGRARRGGPG